MNEIMIHTTGNADVVSASNGSLNVTIPIRITRRGRRKAVTLPDGTPLSPIFANGCLKLLNEAKKPRRSTAPQP